MLGSQGLHFFGETEIPSDVITGSGEPPQIAFFDGVNTIAGDNDLTWDNTNKIFIAANLLGNSLLSVDGTDNNIVAGDLNSGMALQVLQTPDDEIIAGDSIQNYMLLADLEQRFGSYSGGARTNAHLSFEEITPEVSFNAKIQDKFGDYLVINTDTNQYALGDVDGANNGNYIRVLDGTSTFQFIINGGASALEVSPTQALIRVDDGRFFVGDSGLNVSQADSGFRSRQFTNTNAWAQVECSNLRTNATTFLISGVTLANGAGVAAGTLTNAPSAGNPTKWISINDNGTFRYIPTWT